MTWSPAHACQRKATNIPMHLIPSPQGQAMTPNPPSSFHLWVPCHPELPISRLQAAVSREGNEPHTGLCWHPSWPGAHMLWPEPTEGAAGAASTLHLGFLNASTTWPLPKPEQMLAAPQLALPRAAWLRRLFEPQVCDPSSPPPAPAGEHAGNCRRQLNSARCFSSAWHRIPRSCQGDAGGGYCSCLCVWLLMVQDGQGTPGCRGGDCGGTHLS